MGDIPETSTAMPTSSNDNKKEPEVIVISDSDEDLNSDSNGRGSGSSTNLNSNGDGDQAGGTNTSVLNEIIQLINFVNTHDNNQQQTDNKSLTIKAKFKNGYLFIEGLQTIVRENQIVITEKDKIIADVVTENGMLTEEIQKLRRELHEHNLQFGKLSEMYAKLEVDRYSKSKKGIELTSLEELKIKAGSLQQQFKQLCLEMEETVTVNPNDPFSVQLKNNLKAFQRQVKVLLVGVESKLATWGKNQMNMKTELECTQKSLEEMSAMVKNVKMSKTRSRKRPAPSPLDNSAVVHENGGTSHDTTTMSTTCRLNKKKKLPPPDPLQVSPPPPLLPVIPADVQNTKTTGDNEVTAASSSSILSVNATDKDGIESKDTGLLLQTLLSNSKSLTAQLALKTSPVSPAKTEQVTNQAAILQNSQAPHAELPTLPLDLSPIMPITTDQSPICRASTSSTVVDAQPNSQGGKRRGRKAASSSSARAQSQSPGGSRRGRKAKSTSRDTTAVHYPLPQSVKVQVQPMPPPQYYQSPSLLLHPPYQKFPATETNHYPCGDQPTRNGVYTVTCHLPPSPPNRQVPPPASTLFQICTPRAITQGNSVGLIKCNICGVIYVSQDHRKFHHVVAHANWNSAPAADPSTEKTTFVVPQPPHQNLSMLELVSTIETGATSSTIKSLLNEPKQIQNFVAHPPTSLPTDSLLNHTRLTSTLPHPAPHNISALGSLPTNDNSGNCIFPCCAICYYNGLSSKNENLKE